MLVVSMGLRLIIEDYEGSTTVFPLGEDAVTIGREEGNTIRLTEKNISRRHLRLAPADEGWLIEDLQSYNGVRVNGEVIEAGSTIHEGDLIQIGDYQLLIGDETSTRATMDLGPALVAAANDQGGHASAGLPAATRPEAVTVDDSPAGDVVVRMGAPLGGVAPTDEDFDDITSGGGGAGKAVVALLLIGALGAGAWFVFGRDKGGASADAAGAAASAGGDAVATGPQASGTQDAPLEEDALLEDDAAEADQAEAAQGEAAESADAAAEAGAADAAADAGAADGSDEAVVEDEPEPDDEPEPEPELEADPEPAATPVKKKRKKKKKPAAPSKSASELLADARSAQIGKNYSKAYKLAKQSYSASPSQAAAQLMGVAACKMGDASKAKSAYAKLSGSKKSALKNVCASAGIDL